MYIKPRNVIFTDTILDAGIYLFHEEAERVGRHFAKFGVKKTNCSHHPFYDIRYAFEFDDQRYPCFEIPCNKRGMLPSLRIRFTEARQSKEQTTVEKDMKRKKSIIVELDEYIVDYVIREGILT